ncbi:unnamed protein product [Mytilus edulis]|uniref:Ig-like domain-containing protein n=1 Tax=Mytilus edulis TaxID=6550 RepID=A0A8S3PTF2_MYTED|nr:unnamed protein product [Mytilus edulis]
MITYTQHTYLERKEQALLTDAIFKFYTTEGSTMNFTVKTNSTHTYFRYRGEKRSRDYQLVKSNRYDIVLRPNILEFQIINVTASDEGFYWFNYLYGSIRYQFELKITNMTCPSSPIERVCAIAGSSPIIKHSFDFPVYHIQIDKPPYQRRKYQRRKYQRRNSSRFITNQIHVDLQIYNVTREDEGFYDLYLSDSDRDAELVIVDIWFINQTEIHTLIGQAGKEMEINCSTDKAQYITALKIESNGSILAIGDNQSVSYSFIPKRTDHLTSYTCVDITHSSIMIEVTLIIRCPVVKGRFTNETIECDSDGFPPIYSVYRLDQNSRDGKLVRSGNLNNEIFTFNSEPFPYQQNGRYTCFVSNGIPDVKGNVLQTWSINVKYEDLLSFNNQTDINTIVGHEGMEMEIKCSSELKAEILIESKVLDLDDFQLYRITAKNRLGDSSYDFAIIDNENLHLNKRNMSYFLIFCSIASVLLVYLIILHVCLCIKHIRKRNKRHHNVEESHNYHTYDEIDTISYRNLRSLDTDDNEGVNLPEHHDATISTNANLQPTDNDTTEMTTDIFDDDLPEHHISDEHRQLQLMSTTLDDTNLSYTDLSQIPSTVILRMDNMASCNLSNESVYIEAISSHKNQTSNDSDSDTSINLIIDNVGDEYENNYQFQESHLYLEILEDRHNSISSTDSNTNEYQRLETGSTREPVNTKQ